VDRIELHADPSYRYGCFRRGAEVCPRTLSRSRSRYGSCSDNYCRHIAIRTRYHFYCWDNWSLFTNTKQHNNSKHTTDVHDGAIIDIAARTAAKNCGGEGEGERRLVCKV
jgi:hypothetical protein